MTTTYANGNPSPGQYNNVAGLNRLMEFQLIPLNNWISNGNIDILDKFKDLHRFASTQNNHTLSQKRMAAQTETVH